MSKLFVIIGNSIIKLMKIKLFYVFIALEIIYLLFSQSNILQSIGESSNSDFIMYFSWYFFGTFIYITITIVLLLLIIYEFFINIAILHMARLNFFYISLLIICKLYYLVL